MPNSIFTPQQKLVRFMEIKADILLAHKLIDSREKYFSHEDKEDMLGWSDRDASSVFLELWENIYRNYYGLGMEVCPFCILKKRTAFMKYDDCSYGARHTICHYAGSDYKQIVEKLGSDRGNVGIILSNSTLKKALVYAEGEHLMKRRNI